VLGDHRLEHGAHAQDLARLDLDVARLAAALGVGLVDQDAGVGQRVALARRAGRQDDRGCRRCLAQAGGLDVGRMNVIVS
jgi:hypothetical protein